MKPLSEQVVGCKNCLGGWVEASKLKKAVQEWIESLIPDDDPVDCIRKHNEIFGEFK